MTVKDRTNPIRLCALRKVARIAILKRLFIGRLDGSSIYYLTLLFRSEEQGRAKLDFVHQDA